MVLSSPYRHCANRTTPDSQRLQILAQEQTLDAMKTFQVALSALADIAVRRRQAGAKPQARVLLILYGAPCSGKSTIGSRLTDQLGIGRVTMDDARHALLSEGDTFSDDLSQPIFEVMYGYTRQALQAGESLICEGIFADTNRRRRFVALATGLNFNIVVVRLVAPQQTLIERLERRQTRVSGEHTEDKISIARLRWCESLYQPPLFETLPGEIEVDTSSVSLESSVALILAAAFRPFS